MAGYSSGKSTATDSQPHRHRHRFTFGIEILTFIPISMVCNLVNPMHLTSSFALTVPRIRLVSDHHHRLPEASGMDTRLSFIPRHFSQPLVSLYSSFPTFHSSRSLCPADTCNDKGFFRSAGISPSSIMGAQQVVNAATGATCPLIP